MHKESTEEIPQPSVEVGRGRGREELSSEEQVWGRRRLEQSLSGQSLEGLGVAGPESDPVAL